LETVIQKATARDPASRYATAAELRDDLRALVDDRPIAARKPGSLEQLGRWSRQNPLAATLAAISVLLLMLLAATASIGYLTTTDANQKLSEKATSLKLKQLEAENAHRRATANWQRAEANLELTMRAFDDMFKAVISGNSRIQSEIDIDGFGEMAGIETAVTAEDAERLKRLLTFYEQFTQQNSDNERLRTELARAYRRVANIYHLVGEFASALPAYEKSVAIYRQIQQANPGAVPDCLNLIRTQSEFATALRANGQPRLAAQQIRQCRELLDAHSQHATPELQLEKARILIALGANNVMLAAADNPLRRSPNLDSTLPWPLANYAFPRLAERLDRGGTPRNSSELLDHRRLQEVHEAIGIAHQLLAADPQRAEYRFTLAKGYSFLAAYQLKTDKAAAEAALDEAISQFETLVQQFPEDLEYRFFMALTYSMNWNSDGVDSEQIAVARATANDLVERSPNVLEYKQLKIRVNIQDGRQQMDAGNLDAAFRSFQSADEALASLANRKGMFTAGRVDRFLADSYRSLAQRYRRSGEPRQANDAFRAARTVDDRLRARTQDRGQATLGN
jgi:hypothetical protein